MAALPALGWAMACNTPFRLYKISTFRGGHSVPFVLSWPRLDRRATRSCAISTRTSPTCCRRWPISSVLDHPDRADTGSSADPLDGVTFRPDHRRRCDSRPPTRSSTTSASATAPTTATDGTPSPSTTPDQPFSQRPLATCSTPRTDVNELHDVADQQPERVAELVDAWEDAAWKNQVFPLDEGTGLSRMMTPPFAASDDDPRADRARHADARAVPVEPSHLPTCVHHRRRLGSPPGQRRDPCRPRRSGGRRRPAGGGRPTQLRGQRLWHPPPRSAVCRCRPAAHASRSTSRPSNPRRWNVSLDLDGQRVIDRRRRPTVRPLPPVRRNRRRDRPALTGVVGAQRTPRRLPVHRHPPRRHVRTWAWATPDADQQRLDDLRAIGTGLE